MNGRRQAVVAGVSRALAAVDDHVVDWAADEAAFRGLPLRLLHAQEWPHGASADTQPDHPAHTWSRHFQARGEMLLAEAKAAAAARHPALEVTTELLAGRPTHVLREAGEQAALLVLGARRFTSLADAFAGGSKGQSLMGHVPCAMALVPQPSKDMPANAPVVVGVDGSAASRAAVDLAFTEAAAAKTGLTAVEVRRPREAEMPAFLERSVLELSEVLAGYREQYPDTEVSHEVLTGDTGYMLASAARHARCLVVGTRGRGGFRGMVLGSTGRSLIHRTHCPLLVAAPLRTAGSTQR